MHRLEPEAIERLPAEVLDIFPVKPVSKDDAQPMNHHGGRDVVYEFEVSQPRATRIEGKELHTIFSSALPGTGKACSITMKGR